MTPRTHSCWAMLPLSALVSCLAGVFLLLCLDTISLFS